jgi:sec-independent protein translocase protein TatB
MDIGWSELLVIGIVALIVIGPKDLPRLFNTLGRFTAKARAMGREFQRAMDEAARESGVQEASADMKAMLSKKSLGLDKVEAAARKFESWDPLKKPPPAPPAAGSETAKLAEERAARAEALKTAATTVAAPAAAPAPAPKPAEAEPVRAGVPRSEATAETGTARKPRAPRKAAAKKSP